MASSLVLSFLARILLLPNDHAQLGNPCVSATDRLRQLTLWLYMSFPVFHLLNYYLTIGPPRNTGHERESKHPTSQGHFLLGFLYLAVFRLRSNIYIKNCCEMSPICPASHPFRTPTPVLSSLASRSSYAPRLPPPCPGFTSSITKKTGVGNNYCLSILVVFIAFIWVFYKHLSKLVSILFQFKSFRWAFAPAPTLNSPAITEKRD